MKIRNFVFLYCEDWDTPLRTSKHHFIDRLAKEGARVQTIKLADVISNARDIELHDPKFSKVYNEEMKDLLRVLTKGDAKLYGEAYKLVYGAFE